MLNWSHSKFKNRLLLKAEQTPNCVVHVVTEEYTSKCCGLCGRLNHKLGGNKTFNCVHCGFKFDRDMNAARNIMIKNLESSGYNIISSSSGESGGYTQSQDRRIGTTSSIRLK